MKSPAGRPRMRYCSALLLSVVIPLLIFTASACYTASFQPVPDYANLRLATVESARITFAAPPASNVLLGIVNFSDIPDVHDQGFLDYVRYYAARKGATLAWVMSKDGDPVAFQKYVFPVVPYPFKIEAGYRAVNVALFRTRAE